MRPGYVSSHALTDGRRGGLSACDALKSRELKVFGDVHFLRQRACRSKEVDELLELHLVLGIQFIRCVVTNHWYRFDHVFGSEGVLAEVFARLLRILIDEADSRFPYQRKAPRHVRTTLDEVARDRATRCKCVAAFVVQ